MSDVTPQGVASKANSLKISSSRGLRGPDAIQETLLSAGHWLQKNTVLVVSLVLALILAGSGFGIWNWWNHRTERKAQEAYYTVEAKYSKLKEGFDRAKFNTLMPNAPGQPNQPKDQAASGDLNKDYGSVPGELEAFAREHAGTAAGAQAAIFAADLYLTYGQPEKAAEIAQIPVTTISQKRMLANLAKMTWANALADKGDCQHAVQIWQQVIDNSSAKPLHPDAFLRSGICYETLNEPGRARELYQKVTVQSENSSAAATAKGLLRALDAKATPPAPSSAPTGNG